MLGPELDEDEKRITDTCIICSFVCVGIVFVGCLVGGIVCMLINAMAKAEDEPEKTEGQLHKLKHYDLEDALLADERFWMNYDQAEEYCKNKNLELPAPKSQVDEDDLYDEISKRSKNRCKRVFLGYKADPNTRYKKVNDTETWPSLKVEPTAGIPKKERDCVYLDFTYDKPDIAETEVCGTKGQSCVLYFTAKLPSTSAQFCEHHPYSCVFQSTGGAISGNIEEVYNISHNVLLLDETNYPSLLNFREPLFKAKCVALAVQYEFVYEYKGSQMTYSSDNFKVLDPEFDCLAFDMSSKDVVTTSCSDLACPLCTLRGSLA